MVDTNEYKTLLEAALDELTEELRSVGIHNPENPQDWVAIPEGAVNDEADENVAADSVEEWDERRALVAALETRYNNITRALGKITKGTYGSCEICKKLIETDRLFANPESRTCKAHMDEEETLSL